VIDTERVWYSPRRRPHTVFADQFPKAFFDKLPERSQRRVRNRSSGSNAIGHFEPLPSDVTRRFDGMGRDNAVKPGHVPVRRCDDWIDCLGFMFSIRSDPQCPASLDRHRLRSLQRVAASSRFGVWPMERTAVFVSEYVPEWRAV